VNEIGDGCVVNAYSGLMTDFATLIIDLSNDSSDGSSCVEGGENLVIIEESGWGDSLVVRFNENDQSGKSVTVDRKFGDIRINLSNCDDMVEIRSTLEFGTTVVVHGYNGNDVVTLGTDEMGMDEIRSSIVINGGDGNDRLVVNDRGAVLPVQDGSRLTRVSMEGLLPSSLIGAVHLPSIAYSNIEELSLVLPIVGNNRFNVESIDASVIKTEIVGGVTDSINVIGNPDSLEIKGANLVSGLEERKLR